MFYGGLSFFYRTSFVEPIIFSFILTFDRLLLLDEIGKWNHIDRFIKRDKNDQRYDAKRP